MAMNRRRTLITSPLDWFLSANPVPPPAIPVLAERGGTQLKTPRPVLVVDTREQNPFDFSRFAVWFSGVERRALKLGDYSIAGLEDAVLAGLRVPFISTETHEMGEEILASYLYQVHLHRWLEENGFGAGLLAM